MRKVYTDISKGQVKPLRPGQRDVLHTTGHVHHVGTITSRLSQKKTSAFYRTSNQAYGSNKPTVHEMQTKYKVISHKFSEEMLQTGMYHDVRFNTATDKNKVMDPMTTYNRRIDIHHMYHYGK
ncbi:unnamed protein product [Menidia menidia]|uniref:(Atlantic silverside) hypothetical protein n=1 Tax=Menidia menidia TaxID=238744 RepID=A0A8S4AY07_9TELE|nr:unnamed protein product [Menidia menidia]